MRADQANAMLKLLQEIRDRLTPVPPLDVTAARDRFADVPKLAVPMRDERPARTADEVLAARMPEAVALGHRQALAALLGVLDGWIDGARSNHAALDHRGEGADDPCWTRFHPDDIRGMVNDAAREMGVPEFALPEHPIEDA